VKFEGYSFGSVTVDGVTYHHDIVVDRGKVQKRKKKRFRGRAGVWSSAPGQWGRFR